MIKDIVGNKYNKLLVLSYAYSHNGRSFWNCRCDCGKQCVVNGKYLRNGETKSCGCLNLKRVQQMGKKNKKYNQTQQIGNKTKIFFDNNEYTIIDSKDYDIVKNICWHKTKSGYARGHLLGKLVLLHNLILPHNNRYVIDHINGNRLDNTRNNLRIVLQQENNLNNKIYKNNHSGYTGVSFHKSSQKWCAQISYKHKQYWLGLFNTKEEAINARKNAEILYFKEYRRV